MNPVQLLIIAPKEFLPVLISLKEFKNNSGVTTELISLEAVCDVFVGRDDAEKVKRCLEHWVRLSGTRYALLVGDNSRFPVRYTKQDSKEPTMYYTSYSPTDLYYGDLFERDGSFDDWDRNRNGYFGELQGNATTGPLNIDDIDLRPDIAVGRVPAHTVDEVQLYVRKIIRYESSMPQPWAREALLIATTDWVPDACKTQEAIASQYLQGYQIHRLYSQGNPCNVTTPPSTAEIMRFINQGVGLVSYFGHGSQQGWSYFGLNDMAALDNPSRLPVVFASACDTSWFAQQPPLDSYVDMNGFNHQGTLHGEVFSAPPPIPACLQPGPEVNTMGVDFLLERDSGAIAYMGCHTGAQPYSMDLAKYFFEAVSLGINTLGDMWRHMLTRYYEIHVPPLVIDPPDWSKVAEFHQAWKFFLFGDPSLRLWGIGPVGSIMSVQGKLDFLRVHDMGTKYGPPNDDLDVEVVAGLQEIPGRAFGFRLRNGAKEFTGKGMLDQLRQAFNEGSIVQIDYIRTGFLNGQIIRVKL
jgi:hypothetical protein